MKKLMIVAAVALAASFANAAAGNWSTGSVYYGGAGSQLSSSSGTAVGAETTTYLFAGLTSEQYSALTDSATIYSMFTSGGYPEPGAGSLDFGGGTVVNSTDAWNFSGGNNYGFDNDTDYAVGNVYAAVVTLHHDADGNIDAYSASTMYTVSESGALALDGVDKVALGWGQNAAGTAATWQSVPEPTSGLLLLIGMAGLALRRRRA